MPVADGPRRGDEAFEWLEKSVAASDGGSLVILVDSLFRGVHSDPRRVPLLRRLGKAPGQVGKIEFKVNLRQPGS